jgi:hypothetical protein
VAERIFGAELTFAGILRFNRTQRRDKSMEVRLRRPIAAALLAGCLIWASSATTAQETPVPSITPVTDLGLNTSALFGLIEEKPIVSWRGVSSASTYDLTGQIRVLRVNRADPFCSEPVEHATQIVSIDEGLSASTFRFEVQLEPLPPGDAWFVDLGDVRLQALAADGAALGAQGGGGISEAPCSRAATPPTSMAMPRLPSTGMGADDEGVDRVDWLVVVAAGTICSLCGLFQASRA